MTPVVEPTLEYLKALQSQGHALTDVEISSHGHEQYFVTVYSSLDKTFDFKIHAPHETFMEHHKAAVEFTGFGPRGLSNLIYAEARRFSNKRNIPTGQVQVTLSQECLDRVGDHMRTWMHYGLVFTVNPSLQGLGYFIKAIPPAQE